MVLVVVVVVHHELGVLSTVFRTQEGMLSERVELELVQDFERLFLTGLRVVLVAVDAVELDRHLRAGGRRAIRVLGGVFRRQTGL